MNHEFNRRNFLEKTAFALTLFYFRNVWADLPQLPSVNRPALKDFVVSNAIDNPGNFLKVFGDEKLKADFLLFLENVYNIYPEHEFHQLITETTRDKKTDAAIYQALLENIHTIKPFLSELSYALPALAKQKKEIASQTMEFLKDKKSINGYLEIGTPGRYVNELKNKIEIKGDLALVNVTEPSFAPIDIAERGQLAKVGRYIGLNNYEPISGRDAEDNSFEVVTNYIGFHHSTLERLDGFISSIYRVTKPGGKLILRDHDVVDENMNHMVALAHDVFNAGLNVSWAQNHQEVRNFRSLNDWIEILKNKGFEYKGRQIFQNGDPTKNALMEFTKI
ncbi:MAG: methyltransferase domain-containing protein [Pseudobdellovibrio sp.]